MLLTVASSASSATTVTTLALYPRITRLLNQLPPNVVTRATFFLTLRGLGALDTTCQRFHPVGLTQKACLMRAGMWLQAAWQEKERAGGQSADKQPGRATTY